MGGSETLAWNPEYASRLSNIKREENVFFYARGQPL